MLYALLYELFRGKTVLGLDLFDRFGKLMVRSTGAAATAFILCLLLGPKVIRFLKNHGIQEKVDKNPDVLKGHNSSKANVPTMGGILLVGAIVISTALWGRLDYYYVLMALLTTLVLGLVGFIDDWIKLTERNKKGMTIVAKILPQLLLGLLLGIFLLRHSALHGYEKTGHLIIPFFAAGSIYLGVLYILLVAGVITASSNAVNLTDGLDGLAAGCTLTVALAFTAFAYLVGRTDYSAYLGVTHVPGSGELAVFCASIVGAVLGFLWFNCHPANVFMGDTGALTLGGAIGYVAVVLKHEIVLFIAGGVFVLEALSVVIQVAYYKRTRKRVFLCAPIHHHFIFKGWTETQVTVRMWLLSAIFALASLATLKIH